MVAGKVTSPAGRARRRSFTSAAMPATAGVAIEVPHKTVVPVHDLSDVMP